MSQLSDYLRNLPHVSSLRVSPHDPTCAGGSAASLARSAGVTEAHAGAAAAAAVASSVDRYRVLFTISGVATDD